MTSNRGEAHNSPALARQPGAHAPSPGAGLDLLTPASTAWRRAAKHLCVLYVLVALAAGFALGVLFTVLEVAR